MDFENVNIWCWLIPLLVGVICGILGYLIGKGSGTAIDQSTELTSLKNKNAQLRSELDACNEKIGERQQPDQASKTEASSMGASTPEHSFDADAAKAAFGKRVKENDLKIVEGIGPKIEQLFHSFDIKTWKALSETSVAKCQEVLDSGGDRYRIHDPSSWPMQAKMAYEGMWKELVKWQDDHKAGKF